MDFVEPANNEVLLQKPQNEPTSLLKTFANSDWFKNLCALNESFDCPLELNLAPREKCDTK